MFRGFITETSQSSSILFLTDLHVNMYETTVSIKNVELQIQKYL